MSKTDYESMSREAIYTALEEGDHTITEEVVRLSLLYADAYADGIDPYNIMSRPALPIEEVALEVVAAVADEMEDELDDD